MKKTNAKKKLLPAIGMLAISAAMLSSATFAWFTMNKDVTVTGLQTTAKAEEGLVIAAYTSNGTVAPAASAFAKNADAYNTNSAQTLLPTFTEDATKWYHQTSLKSNHGQIYAESTAIEVDNDSTNGDYYYELNKFQIKSYGAVSGSTAATQAVYVKDVQINNTDPARTAQDYDPALRVLIKTADNTLIFGQNGTETGTFNLLGVAANGTYTLVTENTTGAKIIDAASTTPTDVDIYMYYDGEDPACKSDNIADFTAMVVDVNFTTTAPAAPAAGG